MGIFFPILCNFTPRYYGLMVTSTIGRRVSSVFRVTCGQGFYFGVLASFDEIGIGIGCLYIFARLIKDHGDSIARSYATCSCGIDFIGDAINGDLTIDTRRSRVGLVLTKRGASTRRD